RLAYDGLNYSTYRNQIRKEMIISEVRNNEVRRRITVLPQEVELAVAAYEKLTAEGVKARVVSMPSTDAFDKQDAAYRESVL
ncbi:hypothetical protein MJM83_35055, partial [Salmonella enterica subsp. enterica serovar Montevideo]|nr:hypothetical protein [Salmonella enterica subsp. enterica serovar Montevideo]